MKTRTIASHLFAAAAGIALVAGLAAGRAPSPQQPGDLKPNDPKAMLAAQEKWMESLKPGEQHKLLAKMVGEWNTITRITPMPGQPSIESRGKATLKMVHDGKFLHQEVVGAMKCPGLDGKTIDMPMTGIGLTGYDNNRKLFTFAWTDNMNTGILTGKGALSQDGAAITMFGEMDEPMTGEMGKMVRYTTRFVSADKWSFEIAEIIYGQPFTVVEVEYTRKK